MLRLQPQTHFLATFPRPHKYPPSFHSPDVIRQEAVQNKVDHTCNRGVAFGFVPAELPICVESDSGNYDSGVAQGEAGVCKRV